MSKSACAPMVCIGEDALDKTTLELLVNELQAMAGSDTFSPEMDKVNNLFLEVDKVGHVELAFAHQGILFVHETVTEWYERYRQLVKTVERLQELLDGTYEDDDVEEGQP